MVTQQVSLKLLLWYCSPMFDTFSMRARRVVFAARVKAGERGADNIGIDDFLLGLILEDQDMIGSLMETSFPDSHQEEIIVSKSPAEAHIRFFDPEIASELLIQIGNLLPQSSPISLTTEIPLSSDLKRVFDEADNFRKVLHHDRIEPLHLLVLILREKPTEGAELLQKAGITGERVLQTLRAAPEDS